MSNLGAVIGIMASAFVVGGLARFAVPGPDPMPVWLTITIGLVGSAVGGGIAVAAAGRDPYAIELGAFFAAVLLVAGYRRLVQKRPLWGPDALRFPHRGVGVQQYRDRLARAGVDPDALLDRALDRRRAQPEQPPENGAGQPPDDAEQPGEDEAEQPGAAEEEGSPRSGS